MILKIFRMLSRCTVEIHTLPVNQEYSLNILFLKDFWGLHSYRSDTLMGRQIFGIHPVHQETFLHIHKLLLQLRILKNWILLGGKLLKNQFTCLYSGEKWKTRTRPSSEMPVWTVSQRFSHLQWRRLFKDLWGRPTTTADFGSPFWQVPHASNLCLLEDKVQDRGMYLFTISYGSYAMDQRSWVGWFSGWIKIFVIWKRNSNAKFWSTRCEDGFSAEQNHP